MRSRIVRPIAWLSAVIVLALGARASTSGDQVRAAGPSPDILPALLTEVRGLRTAMEHPPRRRAISWTTESIVMTVLGVWIPLTVWGAMPVYSPANDVA
jgi:hypothetical protein